MFFPLGDAPNDSGVRPWINYSLIALNVGVYLWALSQRGSGLEYSAWVQEWGYVPLVPRFETFFTHMFMHGGFLHLAGNMLFLWVFGDNVERRLGHAAYLLFYLACGLAAVLLFHLLAAATTVPMVGASGAVFGVLGFYFLAFPRNQVRVLVWVLLIFTFWIPARVMLGLYFVYQLIGTLSAYGSSNVGGVAFAAHVGGFIAGLGLAGVLRATTPRTQRVSPVAADAGRASELLAEARRHLSSGRYPEAESVLRDVLRRHLHGREAPEAALLLGLLQARVLGRPEAAREPLKFAAHLHPEPSARRRAQAELERIAAG